jgi:hypothetical protein
MADYRRTRREALIALLIWALAALWTVGVSYWLAASKASWHGIPIWALGGVLAPWVVFFAVHAWYSVVLLEQDSED